jgi:hypothetical protein
MVERSVVVEWVSVGLGVAACLCVLALVWLPPMLPGQDAPNHLLDSVVFAHPERFSAWLVPNQPFTAVTLFMQLLVAGGMDPTVACRLYLTSLLAAGVVAAVICTRVWNTSAGSAVVGVAFLVTGWPFLMGFYNFISGALMGLLALAIWTHSERSGRGWALLASVMFVVACLPHLPGAALVLGFAVLTRPWETWRNVLAVVALPAAWILAVMIAVRTMPAQPSTQTVEQVWQWSPWGERLSNLLSFATHSYSPAGRVAAAAVIATWLAALVLMVAGARPTGPHTERGATRWNLQLAVGVLLVGYLVAPTHMPGWHFAGPRLAALAIPMVLWVLPRGAVLTLPALVASVVALGMSVPGAVAEGRRIEVAVSQFSDEPAGRAYAIIIAPEAPAGAGPFAMPMLGTGIYGLEGGGAVPGMFAGRPAIHNLMFATNPVDMFPATQPWWMIPAGCVQTPGCINVERDGDRIALAAAAWDSALMFEVHEPLAQRLELRGYERPAPATFRPRLSGLDVALAAWPEVNGQPVVVMLEWDTVGPIAGVVVDGAQVANAMSVPLGPVPAGPAYLSVFADFNGNQRPDEGEPVRALQQAIELIPGQRSNWPTP